MRKWNLLGLALFFILIPQKPFAQLLPLSTENELLPFNGYTTQNIFKWGLNCSQELSVLFMMQGHPQFFAWGLAVNSCSCVIDSFREEYSYQQAMALSNEKRKEKSYQYALLCNTSSEQL